MKKKLWIVVWGLKDGGAEALAREYARLVDKQVFEPTIVAIYPYERTANYQKAKNAGLRVITVFKKRNVVTRAVRVLLGNWYVPYVLKKMLRREKPDIIHFNSQVGYYFAPLREQLSGINLLYTCHSEASSYFSDEEQMAVSQLIREPGLRLIALHDDMRLELNQKFGKDDSTVIRNGVELSGYRQIKLSRDEKRRNIGVTTDAYVVGHIGRFAKVKNHGFLLQIFEKILKKQPKAHLLLVGNGELQEEIQQRVREMHLEDRVTILSHRTDIPELLHVMDVMVFPSFFEGLSVVLVEAQASGLRCVVSDSINPANYLSETTIPVSLTVDAEKWADIALDETVRNPEYGNIEDYDMNKEIRRLERLYQGKLDV